MYSNAWVIRITEDSIQAVHRFCGFPAGPLLDNRVFHPPVNIAFQVRAVRSVDHREAKGSSYLVDCG